MENTQEAAVLTENFITYTNENIFLTGKAGTGKTTLLKKIISQTHKKTLVTAPTGIAALNAGGVTLHSQFQLPFGGFLPINQVFMPTGSLRFETKKSLGRNMQMSSIKRNTIRAAELLIIDEVSMLRADLLDAIDQILRMIRRNQAPFGNIQVLFIGDLLQLPPVIKNEEWDVLKNHYASPFFFDAQVMQQKPPVYLELTTIYRQADTNFTEVLNRLRHNQLLDADIELLNKHYKPNFHPAKTEGFIRLCTHNRDADLINRQELDLMPARSTTLKAAIAGDFPEHIYPVEANMEMKLGAQVMFIKNDSTGENKYYNGKIGWIEEIGSETLTIDLGNKDFIKIGKHLWKNIRYNIDEATKEITEEELGTFEQYPLRLAWAITIHKSQGLTFEKAILDIEKVFASGQAYVAFSRLKSLNGLVLSSPIRRSGINPDQSVMRFEEKKDLQGNPENIWQEASAKYLQMFLRNAFNLRHLCDEWRQHLDSYNAAENKSTKQTFKGWAENIYQRLSELESTGGKFIQQIDQLSYQKNWNQLFERLKAAVAYFEKLLKAISSDVFLQLRGVGKLAKTKEYYKELELLDASTLDALLNIKKAYVLFHTRINGKENADKLWKEALNTSWRTALLTQEVNLPAPQKKPKKEKGETQKLTLSYIKEGLSIEEIATLRGLAVGTIEGHVSTLIKNQNLDISEMLSTDAFDTANKIIQEHPDTKTWDLRDFVSSNLAFRDIKWVAAYHESLNLDN